MWLTGFCMADQQMETEWLAEDERLSVCLRDQCPHLHDPQKTLNDSFSRRLMFESSLRSFFSW